MNHGEILVTVKKNIDVMQIWRDLIENLVENFEPRCSKKTEKEKKLRRGAES